MKPPINYRRLFFFSLAMLVAVLAVSEYQDSVIQPLLTAVETLLRVNRPIFP